MQHWQVPFLGLQAFPAELTPFEIRYFFTFTASEREAIFSRYGDSHRLAAAIQIGFLKMTGRPLDAFDTLPIAVLRHLGTELDIAPPALTSLRALYSRRSTLYEHHAWAAALLGFRPFTERRKRALARQVRREAHNAVTTHRLVAFLEWLQQAPRRKLRGLKEQLEKVEFLKALHVDAYALDALRLERQRDYARHMRRHRPARFRALKDPRRTLEMVCFLRITVLQSTDVALSLAELLIQELHARAVREVRDTESRVARTFKPTLRELRRVLHDPTIPDAALRQSILALMPSEYTLFPSRAAAVRWKLHEKARQVRPLLQALLVFPFAGDTGSSLIRAFSQLRAMYERQRRSLPWDVDVSFAPRWATLIESPDRQRALRAFEAATLFAMRTALRNGSVWIAHSLAYRSRTAMLISDTEWETHRRRFYAQLGLPRQASGYIPQLLANLEAGLVSLAEAVEAGEVIVDDKGIHLKALEAEETPPLLEATKDELFKEVGAVQLPDLLMAIDNETYFSWRLLGHAPTSETELLLVYAALLAHGTELDAAAVTFMIPKLSYEAIADAMRLLEEWYSFSIAMRWSRPGEQGRSPPPTP